MIVQMVCLLSPNEGYCYVMQQQLTEYWTYVPIIYLDESLENQNCAVFLLTKSSVIKLIKND